MLAACDQCNVVKCHRKPHVQSPFCSDGLAFSEAIGVLNRPMFLTKAFYLGQEKVIICVEVPSKLDLNKLHVRLGIGGQAMYCLAKPNMLDPRKSFVFVVQWSRNSDAIKVGASGKQAPACRLFERTHAV
jgi:hypothetical protein